MNKWILAMLVLASMASNAFGDEYVRATVYCYGWDTVPVSKQTVDDVRKHHIILIDIRDAREATLFAKSLGNRIFSGFPDDEPVDVRMVVDLFDKQGSIRTYFASRSTLYSPGGVSRAPIDEAFRQRFRFGK